jgi:hypothetical protein
MALISPGVQVTIIDESQYTPTAAGSVAFVLLATAQNKTNPSGTVAIGTTLANAGKITTVTSQRDLVNLFGSPNFEVDAAGNPINGSELNEYGLLSAYSALGVANKMYVQRANVDVAQLDGTSIRPTGTPNDGVYWLDLTATNWGVYEWTNTGFTLQTPDVITDSALLNGTVPIDSYGAIGTYAVVVTNTSNPIYYKNYSNDWVLVGSEDWKLSVPAVTGLIANSANLSTSQKMVINGSNVELTAGATVSGAATAINQAVITGVRARVNADGYLEVFASANARSNGTTVDGKLSIGRGTELGAADCAVPLGLIQSDIGSAVIVPSLTATGANVNAFSYSGPTIQFSSFSDVPAWRATDKPNNRPYGSVWFKTSATGNGANWGMKQYSASIDTWTPQTAPVYVSDSEAIRALDSVGGGAGIALGSIYIKADAVSGQGTYNSVSRTITGGTATFKPYVKTTSGLLKVTGTTPPSGSPFTFTAGHTFTLTVSVPGSADQSANVTIAGNVNVSVSSTTLVSSISAVNLPNIIATVEATGAISISHLAGGTIQITERIGTPLQTAGITGTTPAPKVQKLFAADGVTVTGYLASPFEPFSDVTVPYTYSMTAPYANPSDGTLWYYNNPLEVDIMINDGSGWRGYQEVANDARGYDLRITDPAGPILSTTEPTEQTDGTPLVGGDIWIDTGDLVTYPIIHRYNGSTWEIIDNKDQISINGILFADARWGIDGTVNPITDDIPSIVNLLTVTHLDDDAPDYRLYARGTLLFNTRRSGYNVKRWDSTYFATVANPPAELGAWVSASGIDADGVPYFGHKAQRNTIVEALKASIASSTALREEQTQFNLIVCPGYPELIQDMITLNNDRLQTAFIIGDSPLELASDSTTIDNWSKNAGLANDNGSDGLVSNSEYLAVYYPSGLATNLDGNTVVVPPSHMMLRTYIRSDNVSYPWFAPAGVRRGLIDNVTAIGYIDVTDGNLFRSIGVTNGLRDVLYTNKVNPLTVLPGVGLVAYGQKTRAAQTSAMDRVNVARLTCYLRTVLDSVARPFIFEPNDTITRSQVSKAFEAVLNDVVAKRGIYDYLVVCDTSNNTPDRIDRNELYVDIAIQPVKAIEFVYIPVRLKNTGESLTAI